MQLFKLERTLDFMSKRNIALTISAILILVSLAALVTRGLNLGIDFTGGTVVEASYANNANLDEIRSALKENGYDAIVQYFGTSTEVLIRLAPIDGKNNATLGDEVMAVLKKTAQGEVEQRRIEVVGPQIGEELRDQGGMALLWALFGILIYVAFRFEFRFSLGAIFALIHDVTITVGFFAITRIEFDLTVLAAILAVIGYSLNDTIVLYDRIRENFQQIRRGETIDTINTSITQTLSRTLVTSLTTLLVLLALYFLGGESINSFAIALIVGVLIGTYSSIYVASSAILMLGVKREDLLDVETDQSELDKIP